MDTAVTSLLGERLAIIHKAFDKSGQVNLAPFSHFGAVSSDPAMMVFAPNAKDKENTSKDTLRHVLEVPEFVINVASWELREQMNLTPKAFEHGVNKFKETSLIEMSSMNVKPPGVAAVEAALGYTVYELIALPTDS